MRQSQRRRMMQTLAFWMVLLCLYTGVAGAANYQVLEFGSRGTEVLQLQKALLSLGFDPNGTDGKYGRGTEAAVKSYQTVNGLKVDGKAGSQTQSRIYADLAEEKISSPESDSATSSSTLKYGDRGNRVRELQTALNKLGYNTNGIDGSFGAGTQRAVIAFQRANQLKADGLAGTRTLDLLFRSAESATGGSVSSGSTPSRTLRKGDTGEDVKQVQQRLKELGYYKGTIDGVYGTGSIAAAKEFQSRNGLGADGVTGSKTINKLFSSSAIAAGSSSTSSGSANSGSAGNSGSSITYVTLRPGDTGEEVRRLQRALADLKYSVSVDGSYGNGTRDAVAAFQRRNGLTADGVAGALTQTKLYSGSALAADSSGSGSSSSSGGNIGTATGPNGSSLRLMHWFNEVKPSIRTGQNITVFDPATSLQWTLRLYSLGRHADSEPRTQADTDIIFRAFGNTNTWTPKPVYVQLPDGKWTLASMHNVPHLSGSIQDNGFDGHLCVHFLRDMDECRANDPNYGVTNQEVIRKKWRELTGEVIP